MVEWKKSGAWRLLKWEVGVFPSSFLPENFSSCPLEPSHAEHDSGMHKSPSRASREMGSQWPGEPDTESSIGGCVRESRLACSTRCEHPGQGRASDPG